MNRKMLMIVLTVGLMLSCIALAGDKPSFEIKPYGYFKLDGAYDQNLTSHGNFVMWVAQPDADRVGDDEQYNMTANETRLGVNLSSKDYDYAQINAKIEFDLYGAAVAENKAELMLRHAYFTVRKGNIMLLAGQSWDLISPLNPSTLNYPVLWGCGNIAYRRPQVSLWYDAVKNESTTMTFAGGFFRTIGTDLTPTFSIALADEDADGSDDGTDAGIPSFQGRWDVTYKWSGNSVRFGASGLWGRLKAETNKGNYENYESYAIAGHLAFSMNNQFGILGEFYSGQNLGSYLGGILNNSTIDGLKSMGGWGSAWVKPNDKVKLVGGYGYDDPDNADMTSGRSLNTCVYGNVQYTLVPGVMVGLEVSRWETEYMAADASTSNYDDLRVQTSFKFSY